MHARAFRAARVGYAMRFVLLLRRATRRAALRAAAVSAGAGAAYGATASPAGSAAAQQQEDEGTVTMAEVARHRTAADAW
eukprot:gene8205-20630_t